MRVRVRMMGRGRRRRRRRWGGRRRARGEFDDGRGVAAVRGLGEGGLHGRDEVGLVVVVGVGFTLRGVGGVGGGGRRGGHQRGKAEGLQARVGVVELERDSEEGEEEGCDAAAHAAVAADAAGFGTALGQSLRDSHSSKHPSRANKALLMGGAAEGKPWEEAAASEAMGTGVDASFHSRPSPSLACDWMIPW